MTDANVEFVVEKSRQMIEDVKDEVVQEYAHSDPKSFTIDQLEEMLEAKRKELGKGIKITDENVLPPGKAPVGFIWVYNRGPEEFEWQFNSVSYTLDGHSFGLFPQTVAEHGRRRSLLTVDPMTNHSTHQLALPDDGKTYGRPLKSVKRVEVIDRSTSNDPAQLGTGEKTRVAVLSVEGAEEAMQRRVGSFSELT